MTADVIPVYRPRLPSADALRPYLESIDQTRCYSNHGPLERRFAAALSATIGSQPETVGTASSGTAALAAAILARAGRARPGAVCLCPAFTFVATAAAAEMCGYTVRLVDSDPSTWSVDPERLASDARLADVGVVLPVAAFGRGVRQMPWYRFEERTGIPVVIDGAASVEALIAHPDACIGRIPVALSLHATKVLASGEGGDIVTTDRDLLLRSIQATNFGFKGARRADTAGINGKMSEYHAAVGLADLGAWNQKRAAFSRVAALYRAAAEEHGIAERLHVAPDVASCYAIYEAFNRAEADAVVAGLAEARAEHRYWYGMGLHREPYFADASHEDIGGVDQLAPRLIGLPAGPDLRPDEIARVVNAVAGARRRVTA